LLLVAVLGALTMPRSSKSGEDKKAEPFPGRKYALVVGIRNYKRDELRPLKYADKGATAIAEVLKNGGYRRVVLMTYEAAADDADALPTARNIREQLRSITEGCRRSDSVVFVFAGHGVQPAGSKEHYLCPIDAELGDKDTLIALSDLYKELGKCKAGTKVAILDACYPRPVVNPSFRSAARPRPQDIPLPDGVLALFSCSSEQFSHESERSKQGEFFHYLLKGLAGAAANKTGAITLTALADYVRDEVPDAVKEGAGPRARQMPVLKGEPRTAVALLTSGGRYTPLPGVKGITNSVGMNLVLIPRGTFKMGSPAGELGRDGDEGPLHDVELSKSFYLAAHTVTVGQFRAFVEATGYRTEAESDGTGGSGYDAALRKLDGNMPKYSWKETGWPQTPRHPVVNVSWNDANKFCEWLSKKERKTYRLPTEAEWEYACRASTSTRYWSGDGDDSLKGVANIADSSYVDKVPAKGVAVVPWNDTHPFTAPVGSFRPNAWGLHDMHGNVFQWCADWQDTNYYRVSPRLDPPGPAAGTRRIYRGGSWNSPPRGCRSAYRLWGEPKERSCRLGFRVVYDPNVPAR
jgi:formylglycine-generating enzyme required for sulfatase activity